jgi:hypothetical protein
LPGGIAGDIISARFSVKFTTFVPTHLNDGTPVEDLRSITQRFAIVFGGCTIEGPAEGHWIDAADGEHFVDEVLKVTVVCDDARLDEAREFVIDLGRRLGQRAMYFEVGPSDGVEFLAC